MKTNYRKAFDNDYLSSADIFKPIKTKIIKVVQEYNKSKGKNSKELVNVAIFDQSTKNDGESLKPMILNATNCKFLKDLTGFPYIEDWSNVEVEIYTVSGVRFGSEHVSGLRLRKPKTKPLISQSSNRWNAAVKALSAHMDINEILKFAEVSQEDQKAMLEQADILRSEQNVG